MTDTRINDRTRTRSERGAVTLAVGVLLLILISLITLYGARVTVVEQRISGNDYRAREAAGTAQAGLNYGIEYARAHQPTIRSTAAGGWLDGTFDLAADNPEWSAVVDLGDCSAPADASQEAACNSGLRGPIRFFGTAFDPDDLSTYEVPMDWPASGSGALGDCPGANCRVHVDMALCEYETPPPGGVCLDAGGTAPQYAVLVFARGLSEDAVLAMGRGDQMTAMASVRQALTLFELMPGNALPPMMAASNIDINGTLNVVVNPDGAGPGTGIPISGWSNEDLVLSGTARFCYSDEYFQASGGGTADLTVLPACNDSLTNQPCVSQVSTASGLCPMPLCDDCECPAISGTLTRTEGSIYLEGIDVVDVDNDAGPTPDAVNFPDDVFEYIFGVPHSSYDVIKEAANEILPDCSSFDSNTSGLYWIEGDCSISGVAGSPEGPLVTVVEGDFKMQGGETYFGLVFAFSDPENDIPGGTVNMRGGATLYGNVISDHQINISNGNFDLIFSQCMLDRIRSDDRFRRLGPVPGSWADHI